MVAKTENGWGSVFNGGITGGAGGIEIGFTDFVDMWIWLLANPVTVAIVTYTGPDFSRIGFPRVVPNSTFSNSTIFEVRGLKNKTIRASQGQTLSWCEIRFRTSSENIIWENWTMINSLEDLIDIFTDCVNIWIRHCKLNMNVFNQSPAPVDGSIDIGWGCNYIAITDCIIENGDKTNLISFSNDEPNDVGKMKVTIRRCKYLNCVQRKPSARYGQIGYEYNVSDDRDLTIFSKCMGVGKLSRFFVYRSTFKGGSNVIFEDRLPIDGLPIEDAGALKSVENVIAGGQGGTAEIRPELVTWSPLIEPNYTLEVMTAAEAETYVDQWAGATMHLMTPTTYTLTLTTTTGGTAIRNPASGTIEQNATVILTATPATGFNFSRWENVLTASVLSTSATYNHVMTADISIVAVFVSDAPIPPGETIRFCRVNELIV